MISWTNTMIVDSSTSIDCTLLSNFKNRIKHLTSFHKHPANIKCTAFVLAYIIFPHCYMQMLRHFTEESHSFGTLVTGSHCLCRITSRETGTKILEEEVQCTKEPRVISYIISNNWSRYSIFCRTMGELSRVIVEITRKESKLDHIREYINIRAYDLCEMDGTK